MWGYVKDNKVQEIIKYPRTFIDTDNIKHPRAIFNTWTWEQLNTIGLYEVVDSGSKGNDKFTRVNSVAPIFESGAVWYPYGETFTDEVIEECAAFPHGANDDYVDSMTQALLRYRQGNFVELYSDYVDNEDLPPKQYNYY